jgi:hypothetical protein
MVYGSWSSGGFVAPVTHRICRFLLTHIRNHQSRSHLSPVLYSRSQKSKHNEGRPNLCASTCSAHSRAVLLSCDRKGLQNMLNPFERHYRRSGRHLSPSAGRTSTESIIPRLSPMPHSSGLIHSAGRPGTSSAGQSVWLLRLSGTRSKLLEAGYLLQLPPRRLRLRM